MGAVAAPGSCPLARRDNVKNRMTVGLSSLNDCSTNLDDEFTAGFALLNQCVCIQGIGQSKRA
jgi:hypothetical protein